MNMETMDPAPEAPVPEAEPLGVVRNCQECSADMLDGQDWCLNCGTAAPGRLGARPGWRAVSTVTALTLVLVLGAVAASYAALSQNANNEVSQAAAPETAPPAQVAQVPATPPATTGAATTGVVTTPPATTGTPATALPTLPTTTGTKIPTLPVLPNLPTVTTPVTTTGGTTGTTGTTTAAGTTTTTAATTTTPATTTTTTTSPALTPLTLGADAVALYDPYKNATKSTDPADSYDGKESTVTSVTTDASKATMNVGLVVDLGSSKTIKGIEVHTSTPDFALEIYGADGSAIPTDILDARWQHLRSRLHVDASGTAKPGDGIEKVKLRKATDLRHVLLWFTRPPTAGATVTISELKVLG